MQFKLGQLFSLNEYKKNLQTATPIIIISFFTGCTKTKFTTLANNESTATNIASNNEIQNNRIPAGLNTVNMNQPAINQVTHRVCLFNDGTVIQHGSSIKAYLAAKVSNQTQCLSQTRVCNDGQLSGSYKNESCSVDASTTINIARPIASIQPAITETQIKNQVGSGTPVDIAFYCSNDDSSESKNLLSSEGPFKYGTGTCIEDRTITIDQIKTKKLYMKKCSTSGRVNIYDKFGRQIDHGLSRSSILFDINLFTNGIKINKNDVGYYDQLASEGTELRFRLFLNSPSVMEQFIKSQYTTHNGRLDLNRTVTLNDNYLFTSSIAKSKNTTTLANQLLCDTGMSPLFIDLAGDERRHGMLLSAPWNGVWFDIMGKNAKPLPYSPMKISWFNDDQIAYIALPNEKGEVLGINQLFGDNTYGPDGKFSTNGFTALAKHDLNHDQVIDQEDAVYEKLKLWIDRNQDGKADLSELTDLSHHEIDMIDLKYDPNYHEKDKYGNEIKYKSVALRKSYNSDDPQRFFMVFDIWFEPNHGKAKLNEILSQNNSN